MKNQHTKHTHRVAMVNRWKESGKSIKAFCKDENIVNSTFHYWHKKLPVENKARHSGSFIKMQPTGFPSAPLCFCELITAKGSRLLFHQPMAVTFLKKLL